MKISEKMIYLLVCLMTCLTCLTASAQEARPRLGMSVTPLQADALLLQHLRLSEGEGLMISNVVVGSELDASGLSQGDILLAIDGKSVSTPQELRQIISSYPKNASVTLDVIQKGEHRQINMKLDSLPDEPAWKYAQPVSGSRNPGFGSFFFQPQNTLPSQNRGQFASRSMIKTMISTPDGMKSSTVTIDGPKDDPDSEITIQIGSDSYQARIGDIEKLPEPAKNAAKQALEKGGNFSFSFGFGGNNGGTDDLMEEMIRRHREQMRMMDEFFNHQFMEPGEPAQKKSDGVLRPVEPEDDDIRS